MTEITIVFLSFIGSMCTALLITPFVIRWASRRGICDLPSTRRIHLTCIPRAGGISLFISFFVTYLAVLSNVQDKGLSFVLQNQQLFFILGAVFIFLLGLLDDIKGLPAWVKFTGQLCVGFLVWFGGVDVELLSISLYKGILLPSWLSLIVTVFWVVLLINAMNLIDGLDGLAAGICLFVSMTLLGLCFSSGQLMLIVGFSALAGSCLGFLRYNFNPASIFMGDCGSYLLGYLLAVLTIQGAMKSQATVALLIPIIALGVPLLDTLFAPIRRFILGKELFKADRSHIHHILLKLGYSQRRAVMIIYAVTVCLGGVALAFVFVKDQFAAFVLVIPGALIFLVVKKLGYLEYIAADKLWGWLRDLTDEAGLTNERRSFLNLQMQIMQSVDVQDLWQNVTSALEKLDFDMAELHLNDEMMMFLKTDEQSMTWYRLKKEEYSFNEQSQFKLEMPLMANQKVTYGILWLIKDLNRNGMTHYTLRRVEHLRRSIIGVLSRFDGRS